MNAHMSKSEVDEIFKLFDQKERGFFTFCDFTRVSKLVQGFEIDQVFHEGANKIRVKAEGKRCKGFQERVKNEFAWQKQHKRQTRNMRQAATPKP